MVNGKEKKSGLRQLTQKEIDNIHRRGYVTAVEILEEWETFGLCAPCNANGPKGNRCDKYKSCHTCLIDFASQQDEWISMYRLMDALGDQPMFNLKYVIKPKVLTKKKD